MRKILFFSATLVAMVFMAFSFNSCKKDKAIATPTSLNGTTWAATRTQNNMTYKGEYVFTSTTDYTYNEYENAKKTRTASRKYSYSNGKGTIDPGLTSEDVFTISGNEMKVGPGPDFDIYTKQ